MEWLEQRTVLSNYLVTNTNYAGTGSLGAAINAAVRAHDTDAQIGFKGLTDGSTINLTSADVSTLTGYGPTAYAITGGVKITIDASGAPGLTIDGAGAVRLFYISNNSTLSIENMALDGGLAQGYAGGTSSFGGRGGGGGGLGGAVFDNGGTFTAEGVTFMNNQSVGGPGGSESAIASETGGGGGGLGGAGKGGTSGGTGGPNGGGDGNDATNSGILDGQNGGFGGGGGGGRSGFGVPGGQGGAGGLGGGGGGGGGGASGFEAGGSAAGGLGGAGGTGGDGFRTRSGPLGGGGGGGAGLGGGIFSNGGIVTLVNDTFTLNSATGGAGGTGAHDGGNGSGNGGAVFAVNGVLYAAADTFSANVAQNGDSSSPTPLDGTDIYVLSDLSDTGVHGTANTTTLIDDILGQATALTSDFVANAVSGGAMPVMHGGNDLISDNNPTTASLSAANAFMGTSLFTGNPELSALGFHGGPTETMALQADSPASNQGIAAYYDYPTDTEPITTDQPGFALDTPIDLGAFQTNALVVNTNADTFVTPLGLLDLRQAITLSESVNGDRPIGFAPSMAESTITLGSVDPTAANVYGNTALVVNGIDLTINGEAAPGLVISGNDAMRIFAVTSAAALTLEDLSLEGGLATGFTGGSGGESFGGGGGGGAGMGGAVYDDGGTFTADGVTFKNNQAVGGSGADTGRGSLGGGGGGGLAGSGRTGSNLTHPTKISGGAGGANGGGQGGSFSGNGGAGGFGGGGGGDLLSDNNPTTGSLSTANAFTGTSLIGGNPLLGALGSNGGDTQTMALLPGSPAIDAGVAVDYPDTTNPISTDQRGTSRPQGSAYDLGAFESLGFSITITGGDNQSTAIGTTFAEDLEVKVASGDDSPVAGGIVTFTVPSSGPSATLSSMTVSIGPDGIASVSATANDMVGSCSITATASGIAAPAAFLMTNALQPVFSELSNQTITAGTTSLTITGAIAAGAQVPVGDDVTITLDGTHQQAVVGNDGSFSSTFNTTALGAGGSPYIVNYQFDAHGSFLAASGTSTVTVVDGPVVMDVLRYGYHAQPTYLLIDFQSALAPTSAENIANYKITAPSGKRIKVIKATYNAATNSVTLEPAIRLSIHHSYRLTINGTTPGCLTGPTGLPLDGSGTGKPGSNYVTSVTWKNLAGRANQLPTATLIHAAVRRASRVTRTAHRVTTATPTARFVS